MEGLLKQFMGQMDKRFDEMEARFDQIDTRLDKMDKCFDELDVRFDKVEQEIGHLREEVRHNQTENRSHFKFIESRLDQQQETYQVVADEIKGIKIDVSYLNGKIGQHDMGINNLNQRLQS